MAATVAAYGITEVGAYSALFFGLATTGTYFLQIDINEPRLRLPRLYGDFVQLIVDLPVEGEFAEIYHQRIWLDTVELTIRRDYGASYVTIPAFKWAVNGAAWRLWVI